MVVFSDGFESGDISAWTGTVLTGATVAATNALAHTGSWCSETDGLQSAGDAAWTYETIAAAATYYIRHYTRWATVPVGAFFVTDLAVGATTLILGGYTPATSKWGVYNAHTGLPYYETDTTAVAAGTWYCVEMMCTRHATAGVIQLWVDGVEKVNVTGLDTGDSNITAGRVGGYLAANEAAERVIYSDCAVIDTIRINCESEAGAEARRLRRLMFDTGL